MTAFEDFVNTELPRRSALLTVENSGVDEDPNASTAPIITGAPVSANLVATNLADTDTTVITGDDTYVIGGVLPRDLTFAPFATTETTTVPVTDFSKVAAGIFTATNQPSLRQAIGTPPSVTNGYTIVAIATNPTTVTWLDSPAASSNSSGTAQLLAFEETV